MMKWTDFMKEKIKYKYTYMNQLPINTIINNGIVIAKSAMPMKDSTSNNESEFSMVRRLFNRSFFQKTYTNNTNSTSVIQRESLGLSNKVIIDGNKTSLQKKWMGGNRDASSVVANRKIVNTGSILSKSNKLSFKNIADNNTARDALIRARAGGYCVPPKVTNKYKL
jgi:hypothetical protein